MNTSFPFQGRSAILHTPNTPGPHGVIGVFHGGISHAAEAQIQYGIDQYAEAADLATLYLSGTEGTSPTTGDPWHPQDLGPQHLYWNAGAFAGLAKDLNYIKAAFDALPADKFDRKRFYVAGLSNGAMMAWNCVFHLPGLFKAAVTVAGDVQCDTSDVLWTWPQTPVLHIHGTQDAHIPFNGGTVATDSYKIPHKNIPAMIGTYAIYFNGNAFGSQTTATGTYGEIIHDWSGGCPTRLIELPMCGHNWPGGNNPPESVAKALGMLPYCNYPAAQVAVDWFKRF